MVKMSGGYGRRKRNEYQRLQFVANTYEQCCTQFDKVYDKLRGWVVPQFADEAVDKIETTILNVATPIYDYMGKLAQTSLKYLDQKLDSGAQYMEHRFGKQKEEWEENVKRFQEARNTYLQKVEEGATFVKDNGLVGTIYWSAGFCYGCVLQVISNFYNSTVEVLQKLWEKVVSSPQVDKVVKTAQPSVEYARSLYDSAHDSVVKDPRYVEAYKRGQNLVNRVRDTGLYKSVSPYVDPTVEKIQNTNYYNKVVDHLRPVDNDVDEMDSPQQSLNSDVQVYPEQ
eukprot:TRINITY_DN21551_c0_g1_i1.p2 TRINITY_DN21551_c0_g1~~TRINITY_DN21551_c0_g1_i1.p2  ORF type:complete len:283 (+),score=41.91 TRINITY_DN21551_c0_g1_i1:58-906(+)